MKRKANAMGSTQSSDSASRHGVVSDAVPSTSLSHGDVSVFAWLTTQSSLIGLRELSIMSFDLREARLLFW